MENQHSNPNPDKIDLGIAELRNRKAAPTRLEDTITRFTEKQPLPRGKQIQRWVWRVGAASAASIAVTLILLQPQTSLASSLSGVAQAAGKRPASIEHVYRTVKGTRKLVYTLWLEGDKMATLSNSEFEGMNFRYNGKRFFIFGPHMGYAVVSTRVAGPVGPQPFSVEKLRTDKNIVKWDVEHDVEWRGAKYDRYMIQRAYDWQYLYVDPATSLPKGRETGFVSKGERKPVDSDSTIEYPADIPDEIFDPVNLPGVHTYDETAIHNQALARANAGMATTTVAGRKIVLRGLFRDLNGEIAAFVTGSEAQPEANARPMKVEGISTKAGSWKVFTDSAHSLAKAKSFFHVDGKPVYGYRVGAEKAIKLPSPLTLRVPIYAFDKSRPVTSPSGARVGYRSKFAGYATFRVKAPPIEVTMVMQASDVFNFMDATPITGKGFILPEKGK